MRGARLATILYIKINIYLCRRVGIHQQPSASFYSYSIVRQIIYIVKMRIFIDVKRCPKEEGVLKICKVFNNYR